MPGHDRDDLNVAYRYLDTESDRQQLINDTRRVRRLVMQMTDIVPQDKWYEPRYHNWSLAAMFGHLQLMDKLMMMNIQAALIGIRFPIPITMVNQLNDTMAHIYKNRIIETTVRGLNTFENSLADFILRMPIDKFTVQVYHPPSNKYLTIEQALQVFFLHHWQGHLQTMREVEGLHYEPPRDTAI
jgi:hypothetical protein